MRKILAMMLIIVLALSLCACGDKAKKKETTTSKSETSTDVETKEPSTDATVEPTTAPHNHEYSSVVNKEATCTENGERTYTCACGDSYTEAIKAVGHSFSKYEYNNDATVDKDGTKTATCAVCGAKDTKTAEGSKIAFTYKDLNTTMYVKDSVNVRKYPTADSEKVGSLSKGAGVKVTGQCKENNWYRIEYDGNIAYVSNNYLVADKPYVADPLPAKYKGIENDGPYKVVNGIAYHTRNEGDGYDAKYNGLYEALCKAGYNNPIYYEPFDSYYILYECPGDVEADNYYKINNEASLKLEAYLKSLGVSEDEIYDSMQTGGRLNMFGDRYIRYDL